MHRKFRAGCPLIASGASSLLIILVCVTTTYGQAKISFATAINLAVTNSPHVKIAQDDVRRSLALLTEAKDAFVPSVVANGGVGASSGITLSVPTIFTINAQSLVLNYSQRDYIRGARMSLQASTLSLTDAREQVEEDTAITYLALDHAQESAATLSEESALASKLVSIVEGRMNAGLESSLDLKKTRRAAIEIELHRLQSEDEIAYLHEHLGSLVGLPSNQVGTIPDSVPPAPAFSSLATPSAQALPDSLGTLSAEANAKAKQERAFGDTRYTWRPQLSFAAQYGRVSPINGVSDYYNLHGNYNSASIGVQIQVPLLDVGRRARAEASMAEASRAVHEVRLLRGKQTDERLKLLHSIAELSTKAELAELDQGIAQDQLKDIIIQLAAGANGSPPMTPKEEANARIRERQRFADASDARLELLKNQIFLLRQTNELGSWLQSLTQVQPSTTAKP